MANRCRILIMAHDDTIRELILDIFSDQYDTAVAKDVLQGTELLLADHFDLLLLEDRMPVIRGRDYLEMLAASAELQALPVVLMSAELKLEEKIKARGNFHFLAMPFQLTELVGSIKSLLGLCEPPHYAVNAVHSQGLELEAPGAAMTT